jgi:protein tyrosine/serine phosphatase
MTPNPIPKFVLGLLLALVVQCNAGQRGVPAQNGITNFDKVDEKLYRGAQPDELGIQHLKLLGVKTIINLRQTNDIWKAEQQEALANGITYTNVPLSSLSRPTEAQVAQVLALIQSSPAPVFVHCQFGCDRTGTIVACYRIRHDKWPSDLALREAEAHGMSRFEYGMKKFILEFQCDPKP